MPETTTVDPEVQLPSVFARAVGIITSPKATFELVVKKPQSVAIVALIALVMGIGQSAFLWTERGQQAMVDFQMQQGEKWSKALGHEMTQDESDQAYARAEKMVPIQKYIALFQFFIALPVGLVVFSAIFWAIFNAILGGTATFKEVMAVQAHAMVVNGLGGVFGAFMAFMRGAMTTVPGNLGQLLPMLPEGSFPAKFLGTLDLFGLWGCVVAGIGLGVLYRRSGRAIGTALVCVYIAIVAAIAAIF
jgi:hypothetical protein